MKDSLFEMLLSLFEKTLTQLKETHEASAQQEENGDAEENSEPVFSILKSAQNKSTRVFTEDERLKLTKASYQFIMRMQTLGVINAETVELVINQLLFSSSRFVSLNETKWAIRTIMANCMDADKLPFLDLVLYHQEDKVAVH